MYIHIGAGKMVRGSKIIGCFDMDGKWDSAVTKDFLKKAERDGRTETAGDDLPRTFVLTDDSVVFTHISTTAVVGRGKIEVRGKSE